MLLAGIVNAKRLGGVHEHTVTPNILINNNRVVMSAGDATEGCNYSIKELYNELVNNFSIQCVNGHVFTDFRLFMPNYAFGGFIMIIRIVPQGSVNGWYRAIRDGFRYSYTDLLFDYFCRW